MGLIVNTVEDWISELKEKSKNTQIEAHIFFKRVGKPE